MSYRWMLAFWLSLCLVSPALAEEGEEEDGAAVGEPAPSGNTAPPAVTESPIPVPAEDEAAQAQERVWPYQEPIFALAGIPQTRVRLHGGFGASPDASSLGFVLEGEVRLGRFGIVLRLPSGLSWSDGVGASYTVGDVQLGARFLVHEEPGDRKHLSVGLDLIAPTSRIGEEKQLAAVQAGAIQDDSNFGRRYLVAQKPMLDMGLIPRLNLGLVPYVTFGQNLGRVSLQTDLGCLILIADNVDESIYGTDRRAGFVLFYDLAAPVAITESLSIVSEFNALVALDGLTGTGFAITLGPRYSTGSFSAALGVQLPLGVDNQPPDDDKRIGRFDSAIVVRHQIAAVLDLSYRF
ncbi:MAG: hypothetical protein GYA21_18165 [Myxococcales bacterium]|nr:hypothetical protein [Myxococcales bacterium]